MTTSVEIRNLVKTFGDHQHVVRDVSLRIEPGELVVLVGPSGCGKTTTLRMIAGLERVTSGEIYIGDKLVNSTHPSKRGVALVFQNFALYPHKSARQNIAFPLESQGARADEIRRRVADVGDMLELTEHLDKLPSELSGGQQQRVSLGRAIVRNPQVLLLDEPLSNLDARLRVSMRSEVKRIQRAIGSTAIYVTHDQVEAMTMGDRIVVMHEGQLAQIGTPPDVYLTPANVPVARTIGSPAMNLLEARPKVEGAGEEVIVEGDGWSLRFGGSGGREVARSLKRTTGATVQVGIRPGALDFPQHTSRKVSEFDGAADSLGTFPCITAEPLGSETLYNLKVGSEIVRVLRPDTYVVVRENESTQVFVRPGGQVHFFDAGSEERLCGVERLGDGDTLSWEPCAETPRQESVLRSN